MKTLLLGLIFTAGCASYIPNVQIPPRLILPAHNTCANLDPLPFTKHSLAELEADAAVDAILRAMEIDLDAYPEPDEVQVRRVERILMWWR